MFINVNEFKDCTCGSGMDSVFGGKGIGKVICQNIVHDDIETFTTADGVDIKVR